MQKESGFTMKLGMFIIIGLVLFIAAIYLIGKQKNLFGSTFRLNAQFKTVSGLKVGNNVRFAGITVGTVDEISLLTDTSVEVHLLIKKEVQKFIKSDASVGIGSDGLMGDKVITITPGTYTKNAVKDNDMILSRKAIDMEDVMSSVKTSVDNAGIITAQLAQFTLKMNNGNGALSKLMTDQEFSNNIKNTLLHLQTSSGEFAKFTAKMNNGKGALSKMVSDEKFGKTLDSTMANLQASTKGLSENMEAAKHNFLLKGFFKKKKKAEDKKIAQLKKEQEAKNNDQQLINASNKNKFNVPIPQKNVDSTRQ